MDYCDGNLCSPLKNAVWRLPERWWPSELVEYVELPLVHINVVVWLICARCGRCCFGLRNLRKLASLFLRAILSIRCLENVGKFHYWTMPPRSSKRHSNELRSQCWHGMRCWELPHHIHISLSCRNRTVELRRHVRIWNLRL